MERDEVTSGSDRARTSAGPARWLGVAAAAVLAGAAIRYDAPAGEPSPGDAAPAVAAPASAASAAPAGRPSLGLSSVCPVLVQRDGDVAVSFTLSNRSGGPVTVLKASAMLPGRGLRPGATFIGAGSCDRSETRSQSHVVGPGEAVLVTFRLATTLACPVRSAVLANVLLRDGGGVVAGGYVQVHEDLAGVAFPSCA